MSKAATQSPWLSGNAAKLRLGVSVYVLQQWAIADRIRTLVEPGKSIRFHAEDVERVLAEEKAKATQKSKRHPARATA